MTIREYLDALNDGLGDMDAERRADVLLEIESHIDELAERLPGCGEDEVVARLSPPDQLARGILEGVEGEKREERGGTGASTRGESRKRRGFGIHIDDFDFDAMFDGLDFEKLAGFAKKFDLGSFLKGAFSRARERDGGEREIEREYELADKESIAFSFASADVRLEEGAGDRVRVEMRIVGDPDALEGFGLDEELSGDSVAFNEPSGLGVAVEEAIIRLPAGLSVGVRTVSGDVKSDYGCRGLDLVTVSGDIEVENAAKVTASTKSGDVTIEGAEACAVETLSGDVVLNGVGEAGVKTASGDVSVDGCALRCAASSASGDISIEDAKGQVAATSASGDISIEGKADGLESVAAKSVSGDVSLDLGDPDDVSVRVSTVSGDIDVFGDDTRRTTRGSGRLTVLASTVSGSIEIE